MLVRLLVLIFLILLPWQARAVETVRLTCGEWPPLISKKFKYQGALPRIISEAFAQEGIEVEFGFFPWKRALEMAREGVWDGSIAWYRTEDRDRDFYPSDPINYNRVAFFHLKGNGFDWENVEDLTKYTIGVTLGYSYGPRFDAMVADGQIRVEPVVAEKFNIKKALQGRVDAALLNVELGYYLLRTEYAPGVADTLTTHPKFLLASQAQHVLFSKRISNGPRLAEALNRGLKILRESGKYDQYLDESRRGEYLQ
ncbi:substrate-binding periplasmic protein [Salidesulfovibrio onnuriiensis]|uniref:substrate-binding periplasmic protein n=1 Tax=Salidesulfovibrio onnuriiensis TaxID=2583823 RepID=UPI0011C74B48|nr:transporter substrate-binding domain-containing protein [Salidesulfovibrio onnuriiensis]